MYFILNSNNPCHSIGRIERQGLLHKKQFFLSNRSAVPIFYKSRRILPARSNVVRFCTKTTAFFSLKWQIDDCFFLSASYNKYIIKNLL